MTLYEVLRLKQQLRAGFVPPTDPARCWCPPGYERASRTYPNGVIACDTGPHVDQYGCRPVGSGRPIGELDEKAKQNLVVVGVLGVGVGAMLLWWFSKPKMTPNRRRRRK